MVRLSPFDEFLSRFESVKALAKGDPGKLKTFYNRSGQLETAVDQLMALVVISDFKRRLLTSDRKWHPQVPSGFLAAWDEFEGSWEGPLWEVWDTLDLSSLFDEANDTDRPAGSHRRRRRNAGPQLDSPEPPEPDAEYMFDPLRHDGAAAFEMAFWAAESKTEQLGDEFEDAIHRASAIGLDAYHFLRTSIGFSAEEVFRRWRQVPVVYAPAHVSNAHGLSEKGSLFDLLDNAVKAYIFGAPAAAIAMCRALMELVLKEHYGLEYQYTTRNGEKRSYGLGKIIALADARYEFIHGKELTELKDLADGILHTFSAQKRLRAEEEKVIVVYLQTIAGLIHRAPR